MPITSNYGWTTPIVSGDFGAWGSILNTAFDEVDADVKALADVVTAGIANVARTNASNTFTQPQVFAGVTVAALAATSITSSGGITAALDMQGRSLGAVNAAAANDAAAQSGYFSAGTNGVDGPLYLQIALNPSAVAANRYTRIQSADTTDFRKLGLKASQVSIGINEPSFVGAEQLRVQGSMYVDTTVTASSFFGSGASLTGIPESAVTNLVTDLATLTAAAATAQSTANSATTTANTANTNASAAVATANAANTTANSSRSFATAINDNVPVARVNFGGSLSYATQTINNLSGGRTAAMVQPPDSSNSTLQNRVITIIDVLTNLVNDLKTRGII